MQTLQELVTAASEDLQETQEGTTDTDTNQEVTEETEETEQTTEQSEESLEEESTEEEEESEDSEETDDDSEGLYKVKVNGEEVEVTLDELQSGYMRQADYTRKTQALKQDMQEKEEQYYTELENIQQGIADLVSVPGLGAAEIITQYASDEHGEISTEEIGYALVHQALELYDAGLLPQEFSELFHFADDPNRARQNLEHLRDRYNTKAQAINYQAQQQVTQQQATQQQQQHQTVEQLRSQANKVIESRQFENEADMKAYKAELYKTAQELYKEEGTVSFAAAARLVDARRASTPNMQAKVTQQSRVRDVTRNKQSSHVPITSDDVFDDIDRTTSIQDLVRMASENIAKRTS